MKVLFDTNVVLDVLLDRAPFAAVAAQLFAKVEKGELGGFLCATTITTIHCLAARAAGPAQAQSHVQTLLSLFEIAPVNRLVLETAQAAGFADFEDAVVHEAGRHAGVRAIVSRDASGFQAATLAVHTPPALLTLLATEKR